MRNYLRTLRGGYFLLSCLILILTLLSLIARPALPTENRDLVVNEIAWMGTEASYYDEWIEFYNRTEETVDLSGWSIYGANSGECLNFPEEDDSTTEVKPYSYLILATGKEVVNGENRNGIVDVSASFTLPNSSPGKVIIYDSADCDGNAIDTANQAEGDWFAGDNDAKRTMERVSPCEPGTEADNWATNDPETKQVGLDADGNPINGTPKAANSAFQNTAPSAKVTSPDTVKAGEEFVVDGSDSADCEAGIASYSWDLEGDGNYDDASGASVSVTFEESGEKVIGLEVEDDFGAEASTTATVVVEGKTNEPPDANPGGPYYCSPGGAVELDGSASSDPDGAIESYEWDFGGDGVYDDATGAEPDFSCEATGIYEIGLKVTDDDGHKSTATTRVEVTEGPVAAFSYSPSEPAPEEEVQFSDESFSPGSSITSRQWDFEDGVSSTEVNPTHSFPEIGTYTVTLTIRDDSDRSDTRTREIQVNNQLSVDAGEPKTVKLGNEVQLEGSVSGAGPGGEIVTTWEVTEAPSEGRIHLSDPAELEPLLVPEATGEYKLKLTSSGPSGIGDSDRTTVTVEENPGIDEEKFAAGFVSEANRAIKRREEVSLEVRIRGIPESARGSVIAHGLEEKPEFFVETRLPLSYRDLKVTRLDEGTAEVSYYYDEKDLPGNTVEESLALFYYLPENGWLEPEVESPHPDENYVSAEIPLSDLKGTPLALAGKQGAVEGEKIAVHGPNPVPKSGCIFWLDLPDDAEGAKLKVYDSAGELRFERKLPLVAERFPESGRWQPVDDHGNRLEDGLYLYRVQVVGSDGVTRSGVKKLVIGGRG